MSVFLGIDIGTTATKGVLLHPLRGIVAEAEAPSTLNSPRAGWAEEDPQEWWRNVAAVTRACLAQAGFSGDEVSAIGVSGMVLRSRSAGSHDSFSRSNSPLSSAQFRSQENRPVRR